jgi:hypothetical protein
MRRAAPEKTKKEAAFLKSGFSSFRKKTSYFSAPA